MAVQYYCRNENRRDIIRKAKGAGGKPLVRGIDYLEVRDGGKTLYVMFVHQLIQAEGKPLPLRVDNLLIEGGVRITNIEVLNISVTARPNPDLPEGPGNEADDDNLKRLIVRVGSVGDLSTYTLRLITSNSNYDPPVGFDTQLSAVEFLFRPECNQFDCRPPTGCNIETPPSPAISYLAKDYAGFRQLLLDRLSVVMPDWKERNEADIGIALVEAMAYSADHLSYFQDSVATEAYLGTARRRVSVRRHARLLNYRMHDGCNARTWVWFDVGAETVLDAGTVLLTGMDNPPEDCMIDEDTLRDVLQQNPVVFQTMERLHAYPLHGEMWFYTWGDDECCLPKGSTKATLSGSFPELEEGDVLVLKEQYGADSTADVATPASLDHRHAVRLKSVRVRQDPVGQYSEDTKTYSPLDVTEIEWHADDALPFSLCLSNAQCSNLAVALGNIVLADHGRWEHFDRPRDAKGSFVLETLDDPSEAVTIIEESDGSERRVGWYRPRLERTGITQASEYEPDDEEEVERTPASKALLQEPREALPCVTLYGDGCSWKPRWDLLDSNRFEPHFVVEIESDGRAQLRFGEDGVFGREPASELRAEYRLGNGLEGNIGAEALQLVVAEGVSVKAVTNPLPARGGTPPESMETVRLDAPYAFRRQERAVTPEDYAEVTQRHESVQRAAATRRWTGSWYTMFVTVDPIGGRDIDEEYEQELRRNLDIYRLAGQDVEVDGPQYVPLDIAFVVCVELDYLAADVKKTLLEAFSNGLKPNGERGFFHPDNFTFGQPVYLSKLVAAAMAVPGVRWVNFDPDSALGADRVRFHRWREEPAGELDAGVIEIGRLEIARLDNDPSQPENGMLELYMEGGL